ncbi:MULTISPECIES: TetR/AcrR family transcriptional regulator [unclassified Mycobacterium]|uniref:TetR/AcrR family transcriptional regulator n=1 Tax=unclassified Mycobacterium TaxID=2642494 RepID=UPI0029C9ADF3|nr:MULTISPECIES: TetR/AcrR family transcriptional regulator [unclassified Mycobacterium]
MPQIDRRSLATGRRRGRPVGSDSAETRNHILQAARHVIIERGYQAATFQAIAVTAGLSRPTLHYYFANREQIFRTLVTEASTLLTDCIAKAQEHESLVAQLSALVEAIGAAERRDRSTSAFLVSARLEAKRNPELVYDSGADLRVFLTKLVTDASVRGELRPGTDPAPVVDMVQSMLWGIGVYSGFVEDAADMDLVTKQLIKLFSHGLLSDVPVS